MLNNDLMSTQRANRAFYFNPEANVGTGSIPPEEEALRVPAPEELATETQTEAETTPPSTTH